MPGFGQTKLSKQKDKLTQEEKIQLMMDPYGMGQTRQNSSVNRLKLRDQNKARALAEAQAAAQVATDKPRVGYSNADNRAGNMNIRDADYIPFNQYMQLKRMAEKYPDNSAYPGIIANMEKSKKIEFDANNRADMEATYIKGNSNTVPYKDMDTLTQGKGMAGLGIWNTDPSKNIYRPPGYDVGYGNYKQAGNLNTPQEVVDAPTVVRDEIGGNVRIDDGKGGTTLWQNTSPKVDYIGPDGTPQSISEDAIRKNTQVVTPSFSGGQGTMIENRQYVPQPDPFAGKYDNSYWDDMEEATPNWGENPGFRWKVGGNRIEGDGLTRLPGAGFWAADTDSDFWKTDAGAAKAITSWPSEDGSLPSFVKKPKQQEVDIQGIKNWFRENWGK
jgi:hypothetical protein